MELISTIRLVRPKSRSFVRVGRMPAWHSAYMNACAYMKHPHQLTYDGGPSTQFIYSPTYVNGHRSGVHAQPGAGTSSMQVFSWLHPCQFWIPPQQLCASADLVTRTPEWAFLMKMEQSRLLHLQSCSRWQRVWECPGAPILLAARTAQRAALPPHVRCTCTNNHVLCIRPSQTPTASLLPYSL